MPGIIGDGGDVGILWRTRLTFLSYRVCILIDIESGQYVSEQDKQDIV